ncbi:MAG: outer membrane beta-barrel protein [Kiritimatiellales bacterium]|nr:outer membrane beta-barrel protein [Kiritimatiellales bacterium]MCF7863201.1 outer membrane beta-barrel protein [Kiritimatiellales bacterium]
MNKGKFYILGALSLVALTSFAAQERSLRVQNSLRVGYDDNVYQSNDNKQGTGFISDILNISGKLTFSSRTDMLLYWQPEVRNRFDADPELVSYHDLYARFNHAVSQRTFLQVSDRFRYQDKDGQSDSAGSQTYMENDLAGALDITVNSLSQVKLGGGYEFRTWDSSSYGSGTLNNDYTRSIADVSYIRELRPNTTQGVLGMNYVDQEYDGSRGGYKSTSLFAGADHNFNPNVTGNARLGYSLNSVDGATSTDTSTPYMMAGLDFNPTARTSINGTMGYSIYRTENSVYNAQDRFNIGVGVRHDLTGKISVSSALEYIYSLYNGDYASGVNYALNPGDANEDYLKFNLRGSYQINRNNFVDIGYEFSTRSSDSPYLTEYDRNRIDIGWRLRL